MIVIHLLTSNMLHKDIQDHIKKVIPAKRDMTNADTQELVEIIQQRYMIYLTQWLNPQQQKEIAEIQTPHSLVSFFEKHLGTEKIDSLLIDTVNEVLVSYTESLEGTDAS